MTGTKKPIRNFEEFRDALAAYRLPGVIIAGLEVELFTKVEDKT